MRRRTVTRFLAMNAGLDVTGPASDSLDLVVVRWNRNARRKWRRMVQRVPLAGAFAIRKSKVALPRDGMAFWDGSP